MKKLIYLILLITIPYIVKAQDPAPASPTAVSPNLTFYKKIVGSDTLYYGFSNGSWTQFSRAAWVKKYYVNKADSNIERSYVTPQYLRDHAPTNTFPTNIVNNTAVPIGSVPIGGTLASTGLTPYEVIKAIFTQTIHPTYNIPTATISGVSTPGNYEVGQLLTITLTSTFTQNDGGALTGTTYKQGASTVTSPVSLTLTTSTSLTVQKTYATGVCKNNNLGVLDCQVGSGNAPNPAPVVGGTATSPAIVYNPVWKRYWGRCVGTTPTNSEILAAVGGSTDFVASKVFLSGTITNIPASGSNHVFVCTLATLGHITSLVQNGFPSFSAYTEVTVNVTNTQSHVDSYYALVSNNLLTADSGPITTN
jgi:hypothetical protein